MSRRSLHVVRMKAPRGPTAARRVRETAALHADVRATVSTLLQRHPGKRVDVAYALVALGIDLAVAITGALSEACRLQAISRHLAPDAPVLTAREAAERLFVDPEEQAA